MPALQVKECPDDTYAQLRECAAEENRSIAQQTLTIIEDFLAARKAAEAGAEAVRQQRATSSYARELEPNGYALRHRQLVERLNALPRMPISESTPRADALLAQIREEEAR